MLGALAGPEGARGSWPDWLVTWASKPHQLVEQQYQLPFVHVQQLLFLFQPCVLQVHLRAKLQHFILPPMQQVQNSKKKAFAFSSTFCAETSANVTISTVSSCLATYVFVISSKASCSTSWIARYNSDFLFLRASSRRAADIVTVAQLIPLVHSSDTQPSAGRRFTSELYRKQETKQQDKQSRRMMVSLAHWAKNRSCKDVRTRFEIRSAQAQNE